MSTLSKKIELRAPADFCLPPPHTLCACDRGKWRVAQNAMSSGHILWGKTSTEHDEQWSHATGHHPHDKGKRNAMLKLCVQV